MKTRISILIAMLGFIVMSCASTYKTISPENLNYSNTQTCNNKLEVSYIYDIYSMTNNKKYSKKEKNNNYRTIAIRIRNLTDTSRIITTDNFRIYANEQELTIGNETKYIEDVSQLSALYLLHGLWGPWRFESWIGPDGGGSKTTYYPIGLAVGIGNMIVASVANTKHKEEITEHEIYGKTIKPGETISGIVILKYAHYDPLKFLYLDR